MICKRILLLCTLFAFVLSCSKKDEQPPAPENQEVKEIKEYLTQTAELSTFATSFAKVSISDADAQQGLTVFAPVNSAITAYDPNARVTVTELSETEVKDHIVKGIIKKSQLTNGQKLNSLSGKEIIVTVNGSDVWLNTAKLGTAKEDEGHIVYGIDDVLSKKPGIAEITVYDGTTWSANDADGKVSADADVALYSSVENYKLSKPAASGKTDATGKIKFSSLVPGTYYVYTSKGDKFNHVDQEFLPDETLVGYQVTGIYQTQAQINSTPHLNGAVPGDFILADLNGDLKLDKNDKGYIPSITITVASNKTVQVKSHIGYVFNHVAAIFANKQEAQTLLDNVYTAVGKWQQLQTVLDGVLSDDADCTGLQSWCAVDNFTFDPTTSITNSFWQTGFTQIGLLNRIITNLPALNLPAAEADPIIAQAKALRGYINLQLTTYYGPLPIHQTVQFSSTLSRASSAETYNFIKSDFNAAITLLPNKWTGADYHRIGAYAIKALLARTAMLENDFAKVKQYTGELIQSASYQLVGSSEIYVSDNNAETIWSISSSIESAYASFFTGRNFSPAIRYSEVLLLNTEARLELGETDLTGVNSVLARRSQQPLTFITKAETVTAVHMVWLTEQYRDGSNFSKLVKWNVAITGLAHKGYQARHKVLPIPAAILNDYPSMYQNEGY